MSQMKVVSWTNATPVAVRNQSLGFTVSEAYITNLTDGVSYYWNSGFTDGYYQTVSSGTVTTSNGVTPLSESTLVGAPVTGVSAAADAVITCSYLDQFSFAVGDTVKLTAVADDSASDGDLPLNFTSTVTAVSSTTVTVAQQTNSGYATYVSGGYLIRVSDSSGTPIPIQNVAIQGVTLGTGVVGTAGDSMVAVYRGENPVV